MYKALKTFTGIIRMKKGEVRDIEDKAIVNDLLKAGYIENLAPTPKAEKAVKSRKSQKGGGEVEDANA